MSKVHTFELIAACGEFGYRWRVEVPEAVFESWDLGGMPHGVLEGTVASLAVVQAMNQSPDSGIRMRIVEFYAPRKHGGYIGPGRVYERPKWFPTAPDEKPKGRTITMRIFCECRHTSSQHVKWDQECGVVGCDCERFQASGLSEPAEGFDFDKSAEEAWRSAEESYRKDGIDPDQALAEAAKVFDRV